jgi:predicted ATPase
LGPRKSTLANWPEDETNFPVSSWLKGFLTDGIEKIVLDSLQMRLASPPGQGYGFQPDGSNLPWVIRRLRDQSPDRLADWVAHLQTALPDLEDVETAVREDDRHCYLRLLYRGGLKVPSWLVSDGTLRLMALTLPAYLNELKGIYLIEEPENGIHPLAVDALYQSLSSVYRAQVMLATHSPVILSVVESEQVLCFTKTDSGATCMVRGRDHPRLPDWHGEVDLGTLFASGVLG